MAARRGSKIGLSGALLLFAVISVLPVYGAVEKELEIESIPPGADVYLRQATRETLIGKTPFIYRAEFHSEVSILRMTFKKQGYEITTSEVSAKQDKVEVNLIPKALFADPDTIHDPILRELQKQLATEFNFKLQEFLSRKGAFEFDLATPAWVTRLDGSVFIVLPLELGKSPEKVNLGAQGQDEAFLRMIWDQLGQRIVIPIGKAIRNTHILKGILLDVNYSGIRDRFTPGLHVKTNIELQCVGGNKPQSYWSPRAFFDGKTWVSGYVTYYVWDPCLRKVPVTRRETKSEPQAIISDRVQYVFPIELIESADDPDKIFPLLGILQTNEKGETVTRRGLIPSSLPRISKDK